MHTITKWPVSDPFLDQSEFRKLDINQSQVFKKGELRTELRTYSKHCNHQSELAGNTLGSVCPISVRKKFKCENQGQAFWAFRESEMEDDLPLWV